MYSRLMRFVLAVTCGLGTAAIILYIAHHTGFWMGGNEENLWFLLRLTVPLASAVGIVSAAWSEISGSTKSLFVVMTAGAALGCAYWYVVARVLGLGVLSFAVQALAVWFATTVAALFLALDRWRYRALSIATVACALAIFLPRPVFDLFAHNERLTVAIVIPESLPNTSASPKQVGFDSQTDVEESRKRVLQSIQHVGLAGTYRIVSLSRQGKGRDSLAILILSGPVTSRVLLPEPHAATVIYQQQSQTWTKIPVDAPTLRREIEVWRSDDDKNSLADFEIPDANGTSLMAVVNAAGDARPQPASRDTSHK